MATCGGEAVCVIDCQTGIVLHKYKAPGEVRAWGRSCGAGGGEGAADDLVLLGLASPGRSSLAGP